MGKHRPRRHGSICKHQWVEENRTQIKCRKCRKIRSRYVSGMDRLNA